MSTNVLIVGQFTASVPGKVPHQGATDADKGIEVYVLSESAFAIWQSGYATGSVYESGRVASGNMQADLPAGAGVYYLVFSNKFSTGMGKTVEATALLRYKSWLPAWFRTLQNDGWSWIGL